MTEKANPLRLVVTSLDDIYIRLKDGIYYNEELKPYPIEMLTIMLDTYEYKEEYEKCSVIKSIIDYRTDHDGLYLRIC